MFGSYDVVFGFGDCFEYCIKKKSAKRFVLYSTGSPAFIQNQRALEAFFRFKRYNNTPKIDSFSKYIRITESMWPAQLVESDAIVTIGNNYIKELFLRFHDNVYNIPSTCFHTKVAEEDINEQDVEKNSFIWFGGNGTIHKGLDLCIEAAIRLNAKLYIVGPVDEEIGAFRKRLSQYPNNIIYLGFLSVDSVELRDILNRVVFNILPSCSESMATSIITLAYNYGSIPIITQECGVDITDDVIFIDDLTVASVVSSMTYALSLGDDDISRRRANIKSEYQSKHGNRCFYGMLKSSLEKAL
ncbi:hypothetical protein BZG78_02395 [Salinivibrio sp. MA351]|nr:hypothetical protein BZG78_02395 [Salinivibrio sp. MA351]